MNANDNTHNSRQGPQRPVTNWLHPRVYTLLIALSAWFAIAVWSFAGSGIVDYLLVIVSGFIFVAVALTLILSRVGHAERGRAAQRQGAVAARLGGMGLRYLGGPAQRRASGHSNSAAACGGGGRHDGDRHRVPLRRIKSGA